EHTIAEGPFPALVRRVRPVPGPRGGLRPHSPRGGGRIGQSAGEERVHARGRRHARHPGGACGAACGVGARGAPPDAGGGRRLPRPADHREVRGDGGRVRAALAARAVACRAVRADPLPPPRRHPARVRREHGGRGARLRLPAGAARPRAAAGDGAVLLGRLGGGHACHPRALLDAGGHHAHAHHPQGDRPRQRAAGAQGGAGDPRQRRRGGADGLRGFQRPRPQREPGRAQAGVAGRAGRDPDAPGGGRGAHRPPHQVVLRADPARHRGVRAHRHRVQVPGRRLPGRGGPPPAGARGPALGGGDEGVPRRLPAVDEARHGPGVRLHRAPADRAADAGDRAGHQAGQPRPGLLRPGAVRAQQAALQDVEVPHDGAQRRGAASRAGRPERGDRARVQDPQRPAGHRGGALPPQDLAGRAAAAVQRDHGAHVAGGAAPHGRARRAALRPSLVHAPVQRASGDDGAVAGERPQQPGLRRLGDAGPEVHRRVVAGAGPPDPGPDDPHGGAGCGCGV
ncbi:MAG: Undecaprenyl-phosphate galactosephosphotransferase, partial [uncultured Gemmatimonadetes bacterium]